MSPRPVITSYFTTQGTASQHRPISLEYVRGYCDVKNRGGVGESLLLQYQYEIVVRMLAFFDEHVKPWYRDGTPQLKQASGSKMFAFLDRYPLLMAAPSASLTEELMIELGECMLYHAELRSVHLFIASEMQRSGCDFPPSIQLEQYVTLRCCRSCRALLAFLFNFETQTTIVWRPNKASSVELALHEKGSAQYNRLMQIQVHQPVLEQMEGSWLNQSGSGGGTHKAPNLCDLFFCDCCSEDKRNAALDLHRIVVHDEFLSLHQPVVSCRHDEFLLISELPESFPLRDFVEEPVELVHDDESQAFAPVVTSAWLCGHQDCSCKRAGQLGFTTRHSLVRHVRTCHGITPEDFVASGVAKPARNRSKTWTKKVEKAAAKKVEQAAAKKVEQAAKKVEQAAKKVEKAAAKKVEQAAKAAKKAEKAAEKNRALLADFLREMEQ
jgi:hypothetical protein